MINAAGFQIREIRIGHRVTAKELLVGRNQDIGVGVLKFQCLRNGLFHVIALDPIADVEQHELVEYVDGGHDHRVAFYKSRNEER